jgi:hypothetical protein
VLAGFANLSEEHLARPFPVQIADGEFSTQLALLQFLSHLAYHLGQIDYHRRVVTGDGTSANAISATDLLGRADEPRV